MRRSIWIVLGISSVLAGIVLLTEAPRIFETRAPDQRLSFIFGTVILVGLCGVLAITCFFPRSHPITLRIIGFIGIISCLFLIYSIFGNPEFSWFVILLRLLPVLMFWLPCSIFLLYKGRLTGF